MIIAGVDNGFSGAICKMDVTNSKHWFKYSSEPLYSIEAFDMPIIKNQKNEIDEQALVAMLKECDHVFIEKAQVMPKQGISSSGRYMMSYGIVRGICSALGIPYTLVTPQRWKKDILADMPKEKGASIIMVKRLFPSIDMSRKKDHGRAEAVLIAEWGRRQRI